MANICLNGGRGGQETSDQPTAVRNVCICLSRIYRHGQLRCVTLHVPRPFSSPTIRMIRKSNHGPFLAPGFVHPSSRSAETNLVGIQPSTQATETQSPWTKKFGNMALHSAPGALDERHELRFCGNHSIRVLGCVATPTNAPYDPFLESGNFVPSPRRQLSGNTNLKQFKIAVNQYRQPQATIRLASSSNIRFFVRGRA